MSRLISLRVFLAVALAALIGGCGSGGGGNDSDATTPSSSDWDTMTWDQDNWA